MSVKRDDDGVLARDRHEHSDRVWLVPPGVSTTSPYLFLSILFLDVLCTISALDASLPPPISVLQNPTHALASCSLCISPWSDDSEVPSLF